MADARYWSKEVIYYVLITNYAQICNHYKLLLGNMADARYWSKEVITEFLEIYKSHPCLWKIKSREYTNRNLKNLAYDALVEFCKKINPEANRDYVVKKIQSFRGSFRKELKKCEESKRSGAGSDEIYTPTLWYFNLLLFTIDQELPTSSMSNIEEEDTENFNNSAEEITQEFELREETEDDSTEGNNKQKCADVSVPSTSHQLPTSVSVPNKRSKISKQNKTQVDFINYCKDQLGKNDLIDEFDAAAMSWAKKMKRMDPTQAIYADMLINRIVNQGLLKQLTHTTVITDQSPTTVLSPLSPYTTGTSSNSSQQGQTSQLQTLGLTTYYEQASNDFNILQ